LIFTSKCIKGIFIFSFLKKKPQRAAQATVEFVQFAKVLKWSASDGTLLQLAEQHNIKVKKSCCKGNCGVCVAYLLSGQVFYEEAVSFKVTGNEILLCSAYPGVKSLRDDPYLRINL